MATNIKEIKSDYNGSGPPAPGNYFPNLGPGKYYFDFVGQQQYKYINSTTGWLPTTERFPGAGTVVAPTVQVGNVTTVPYGSPATVTDRDAGPNVVLDFEIPQGPKGDPGTSTPGGSISGFTWITPQICESPVNILVLGTGTTAQVGAATSSYPGIGCVSTDTLDWANLTYALALGNQKKKGVFSSGVFKVNKMVDLGKNSYRTSWNGFLNTEVQSQFNTESVVGRPKPTDNADANLMIQATYNIQQVTIKGNSGQTCFEPGPTYSSLYSQIRTEGGTTSMHLKFNLNARVVLCDAAFCQYGFIADMGDWTGATSSNSQSNHTQFIQCHASGGTSAALGKVGFAAYASSGVKFQDCIVEWYGFERGIDADYKNSTVVKSGGVFNCHIEGISGNRGSASGDAFFRVRMPGTYTINNSYQQYAGCMINAGTSAGQLQLIVEQIPWVVKPSDGKLFVNAGNCFFDFRDNGAGDLCNPNNFSSLFYVGAFTGGTAVATTMNQGFASGINRWCMRGTGFTSGVYSYTPSVSRMAEGEPEPEKTVRLILTAKPEAVAQLMKNPILVSLANQMLQNHEYYFETTQQAQEFAAANPDYNHFIS